MHRDYADNIHTNKVIYFTGLEVEHTPAFSKKTLFVVGIRPVEEILKYAEQEKVSHIYLGANQSFNGLDLDEWKSMTKPLLAKYLVTLDYSVIFHLLVVNSFADIWSHRNLIPQISCKLPYMDNGNANTTLKLDDETFRYSNQGVWCLLLRQITDPNKFTSWQEYTQDKILLTEDDLNGNKNQVIKKQTD